MKQMFLLLVLAFGCTNTTEIVVAPDGSILKTASCTHSLKNCYLDASRSCPSGYKVVYQDINATPNSQIRKFDFSRREIGFSCSETKSTMLLSNSERIFK